MNIYTVLANTAHYGYMYAIDYWYNILCG